MAVLQVAQAGSIRTRPASESHAAPNWGSDRGPIGGSSHRRVAYAQLAELTGGAKRKLIAVLPVPARFSLDPRDGGRFDRWFLEHWHGLADWQPLKTTVPFFAQGEPGKHLDEQGFPYLGVM